MSPVTKSSVTARLILALFDPLEDNPRLRRPRDVGEDTPQNRAFARRVIGHYNRLTAQRDDIWLCLGVFRVDPKCVTHNALPYMTNGAKIRWSK
jgi:hypothetical protein